PELGRGPPELERGPPHPNLLLIFGLSEPKLSHVMGNGFSRLSNEPTVSHGPFGGFDAGCQGFDWCGVVTTLQIGSYPKVTTPTSKVPASPPKVVRADPPGGGG